MLDRDQEFTGDLFRCSFPGCGGWMVFHVLLDDMVKVRGYKEDCPCCGDVPEEKDVIEALVASET